MNNKIFVTTSIPYVNARPHLGHALEFVQADVVARFFREKGKDVYFLSGTDDNALKNVQAAEAAHLSIREWVEKHAQIFNDLLRYLSVSNNDFIRTGIEERHIKGALKFWTSCNPSDVYKKKYKGLYCVGCEEFKLEKELINGECIEHPQKKLEIVEEENYFFKLSRYEKELVRIIELGELRIIPEARKNEVLSFIKAGLQDFSISRSKERAKGWGVPVPHDPDQIMYVWFDALTNYVNALGYAENEKNFRDYWENAENIIHIIGKGISRFHAIYWPAMLLSAKMSLPKTLMVHGYITINGQKISKTLGNVIDPFSLIEKYGEDRLRYYILREFSPFEDGDFSEEKFKDRCNGDLANGLGNFASRVSTLAEKAGLFEYAHAPDSLIVERIETTKKIVASKLAEYKFHEALAAIFELISFGDIYINEKKPWQSNDKKVLYNLIVVLDNVALFLRPFIPHASETITRHITWNSRSLLEVKKVENLFPRI